MKHPKFFFGKGGNWKHSFFHVSTELNNQLQACIGNYIDTCELWLGPIGVYVHSAVWQGEFNSKTIFNILYQQDIVDIV